MTHGSDHSPLPWRLESRELGAGKVLLLVLAANGDLVAYTSHAGQPVSYLTEEGRHVTRTPEQIEGNYALLVRAVNASKTLVDVCTDVAGQLRSRSEALRLEGRAEAADGITDLAAALEAALGKVADEPSQPAAPPPAEAPAPESETWSEVETPTENGAVVVEVVPLPPEPSSQGEPLVQPT